MADGPLGRIWNSTLDYAWQEGRVIKGAPLSFGIAIALSSIPIIVVTWKLVDAIYNERIAILQATLQSKDERITQLSTLQAPAPIVVHESPSADEITKAAAPRIEAARQRELSAKSQTDEAIRQRDAAFRERDAVIQQHATPQTPPQQGIPQAAQANLTAEDIAKKIGVWQSIDQQMNSLAKVLDQGYTMLAAAAQINPSELAQKAAELGVSVYKLRLELEMLHNSYYDDADVVVTLKEAVRAGGRTPVPGTVFDRLIRSFEGFSNELRSFVNSPPQNLENSPYITALKRDLNAAQVWLSANRATAATKSQELSQMKPK
jgi:hypothetical protein